MEQRSIKNFTLNNQITNYLKIEKGCIIKYILFICYQILGELITFSRLS
jgi:hypothetical protein